MFQFDSILRWLIPMHMGFAPDGDGNGGNGNGDGDNGGDQGDAVSKADLDAQVAEVSRLKQELEDVRMEVFSSDYLNFLDGSGKKEKEDKSKDKKDDIADDDFEKMSKAELYRKAREDAKADMEDVYKKDKDDAAKSEADRRKAEVKRFEDSHEDFSQYRSIMHSLSLDPKNANMSLQELYDSSKALVKRAHTGATDAEKKKQEKVKGEKPGGASESFEKDRKLSAEEAAEVAWDETAAEGA